MIKKVVMSIFMSGALFLSSCASPPGEIRPAYVSPLLYLQYDCDQIAMEMERVSRRLNEVHSAVLQRRNKDSKNMAIGMILFFPSLFYIKGDGPEAVEFARLQGEMESLEKVAIQKKCDLSMLPKVPDFKKESSVFTSSDSSVYHKHDCPKLSVDDIDDMGDIEIVEFESAEEARNAGGEPCSYCKPKGLTKNQERLKKGR